QSHLPSNAKPTHIVVGEGATCAVGEARRLYCWGNNDDHRLGIENIAATDEPQLVREEVGAFKISGLWMGDAHGCMQNDGDAFLCWGDNRHAQAHASSDDAIETPRAPLSGIDELPSAIPPSGGLPGPPISTKDAQFILTQENTYAV